MNQQARATRQRTRLMRPVVGVAVACTALLGGGLAYAYWPAAGSGSDSATNGDLQAVTVTALVAGDTPAESLIPGGQADVILRLSNPNAYAVQVYSVSGNGAVTPDAGHAGCTTTGVTFTPPPSPTGVTVPADSTRLLRFPAAASMSTSSLAACQGASFQVPVTVTVRR
jgi:hypothetical protein